MCSKTSKYFLRNDSNMRKRLSPLSLKSKFSSSTKSDSDSSLQAHGSSVALRKRTVKIEYEDAQFSPAQIKIPRGQSLKKKEIKAAKADSMITELDSIRNWKPLNWRAHLAGIKEMRSSRDAPVDTMGAAQICDSSAEPAVYRYHVLLSLLLSSQTKDQVTSAAMMKLREHGLNIDNILATSEEDIALLIHPVGFWKRKAEYIKKTSQILKDKYSSDIPQTLRELLKLPGIGPKMAHLIMDLAWNKVSGICVDTHVHRIANRLCWVKKPTKTPEETRVELEDWMPKEIWSETNLLLVGFGQQMCLPIKPRCTECLIKDSCPVGKNVKQKSLSTKQLQTKTDVKEQRSPKKMYIKKERKK